MKVWIQPLKAGQKRFCLDADPNQPVSALKKKIEEAKGILAANQRLILLGQVLKDEVHLQDQGVHDAENLLLYTKTSPVVKSPEPAPPAEPAAGTSPVAVAPVMAPGAQPFNPLEVQNILRNLVNTYIPPGPNYVPPPAGTATPPAHAPATATLPAAAAAVPPAAAPPPVAKAPQRLALPVLDPSQVQILMEAGFSENAAKKALLFNGGDPNGAMDWLLEHSNDLDIDLPLNPAQLRGLLQRLGPQVAPGPPPAAGAPPAAGQTPAGPPVDPQVEQCMNAGNCSFHATGRNYKPQFYFHCYTCGFKDNEGCCAACTRQCHRGHRISEPMYSPGFYCDCGAGSRFQCKSMPNN